LNSRSLVRDVNLRIHSLALALDIPLEYICECAGHRCLELLPIGCDEFAEVLTQPGCYVVAAGHDGPNDRLVSQRPGYLVVHWEQRTPVAAR
jgi:hypothetical protein